MNKVATAIHLCFDVMASSLPSYYKDTLLQLSAPITKDRVVLIKAQEHCSQEQNSTEAIKRL